MTGRWLAQRETGDGPGDWLDTDLPLSDPNVTDALSGPPQLTATIEPAYRRLIAPDRRLLLEEGSTAIYHEVDGLIRGGWLLKRVTADGPKLGLEASGFCGEAADKPYMAEYAGVQVDPLDVFRMVWAHLQSQPGGNFGLVIDGTTSDVRVGTEAEDVAFQAGGGEEVSFTAGPYKLDWWSTDDLGGKLDELARDTPFDYHEEHEWNADRSQVLHRIRLGYPRLGRRRADLRFVYGENVVGAPQIAPTSANEVLVRGAGEGRGMVRASASVRDGRPRSVVQVDAKDIRSAEAAAVRARQELEARQGQAGVSSLTVRDSSQAPLGSFAVGDEVRVQAETDWADLDRWVRIVSVTTNPQKEDVAVLSVVPS